MFWQQRGPQRRQSMGLTPQPPRDRQCIVEAMAPRTPQFTAVGMALVMVLGQHQGQQYLEALAPNAVSTLL